MRLISVDDLAIDDLNLYERPIVTDRSNRLNWSVRSRQGLAGSVFFGGQAEPARWNILFKCNDIESRDAILAVLGGDVTEERRLLAMRDDVAQTRVLAMAALAKISEPNEYDIFVDFESVAGSVWTSETAEETVKSFTSTLDQAVHLTVPGNTRTAPRIIIRPTGQRTTSTATAGWRYRRRYVVANNSDEPFYRLPLRISLGDTTPLTTTKAQADGDDVRVVIGGIEQQRTLVTWDTAASYVWFIVDALPAGASMVVEVWYGNSLAANPPTLTYPNLPPFTLTTSNNGLWIYPTGGALSSSPGLGAWHLSQSTAGAIPDYTVPGAWRPALTLDNPNNDDLFQLRNVLGTGADIFASMEVVRYPGEEFSAIVPTLQDGFGIYHPLGIEGVVIPFWWVNASALGALVVLGRQSAASSWIREWTHTATTAGANITATQTLSSVMKHVATSIWPINFVRIPPDAGSVFSLASWDGHIQLTIHDDDLSITGGTEEEIYELAWEGRIGGGADWTPPYRALLIGNARGESGEGTPRCAVTLTQALVIDCDERTHEVWSVVDGELSAKVESVPAHAVVPVVGWWGGDDGEESPSNGFLEVVPVRNPVPNGSFDSTINSWEIGAADPSGAAFALIATYGQLGSGNDDLNTPGQVAIDQANGWIYIADTANNRLIRRVLATGAFSAQITGLAGITGACVDLSGNVYVAFTNTLRKYNSALVQQWSVTTVGSTFKHMATDGTHYYVVITGGGIDMVQKRLCSTGAGVGVEWGTTGSGNGQFSTPWGIVYSSVDGLLYVVDSVNARVQVFTVAGVYQRQWAISANARGIAHDASGDVLVAEYGSDLVKRYTNVGVLIDSFAQANPDGIAIATGDIAWVANADDDNLAKWDELIASTVRAWDSTIGGDANGSHKTTVTAITAGAISETISSAWFPVNGRESINLAAWVRSSHANLTPRLRIIFGDDAEATISTVTEAVWTPVANTEYERLLAARVPDRATQYRIGLLAYAAVAGAVGSVWHDDVDLNGNALVLADQAMGTLEITAEIQGRWL